MFLNELKDSSWAETVFQISPVGDTNADNCQHGKWPPLMDLSSPQVIALQ
jgi:hypothetical protein